MAIVDGHGCSIIQTGEDVERHDERLLADRRRGLSVRRRARIPETKNVREPYVLECRRINVHEPALRRQHARRDEKGRDLRRHGMPKIELPADAGDRALFVRHIEGGAPRVSVDRNQI